MTRRVPLPTDDDVRVTLARLRDTTPSMLPTVIALAKEVGLTNSTFWRYFPDIAPQVADARRNIPGPVVPGTPTSVGDAPADSRRLRTENSYLREQLTIAAAHIQYLTLENHTLRDELEQASTVTRLPTT